MCLFHNKCNHHFLLLLYGISASYYIFLTQNLVLSLGTIFQLAMKTSPSNASLADLGGLNILPLPPFSRSGATGLGEIICIWISL